MIGAVTAANGSIVLVSRRAIERRQTRGRPMVVEVRTGDVVRLTLSRSGLYQATNTRTARVARFHTLPELLHHLRNAG